MKLLIERVDFNQVENKIFIDEATKTKEYWVEGIFMQSEKVNANKRFYTKDIMQREVDKYQDSISKKQSLGELNHADAVDINYERASHLITELKMTGNDVTGRAKILKNNIGNGVLIPLLDEGVKIGMSSRALGSLEESLDGDYNLVQPDFALLTIDCVSNPSAQDAWVNMVENKDFIINNGFISESKYDTIDFQLKNIKKGELKEGLGKLFQDFMNAIAKGE